MAIEFELALVILVVGIFMLLAEAMSPGSFIIVPATVLVVLGGVGLLYPDWLVTWYAPVLALVVLVPMTLVTIKLYQNLAPPGPPETTVATSLIGKVGVVEREVLPDSLKGKVRVANDTWSATSSKVIPMGAKVIVRDSMGVHVVVEELPAVVEKAL